MGIGAAALLSSSLGSLLCLKFLEFNCLPGALVLRMWRRGRRVMFGDLRQKQRAEDCGESGSEGCCVGLRGGSWEDQLCDRTAVSAAHGGVGGRRKVDSRTEIFKQGDSCAGCTRGRMQWAG